jgi:glycosyltransferase involved in cell wall biosynthesis
MSQRPEEVSPRPRVSVVIPVYNTGRDIADALDSVFRQTFSSFEVIVVDDASSDSNALEAALGPFLSRVIYIRHAVNRGAGAARNTALRIARGDYVAFLDADDLWRPEFLSRQVWFLDAHHECALVYSDARISGESPLAGKRFMETAPSLGDVTLFSLIRQTCNIPLSTVVMRREPLFAVGLFDEAIRRGQDYDLWLRLAAAGVSMRYQRVVLTERRVRADGLSGSPAAEFERVLHVLANFGRTQPSAVRAALGGRMDALRDELEILRAKDRLRDADFAAARHHLSATRNRCLKWRLALLGLQVAPRLLRRAYLATQPAPWKARVAAEAS